MTITLDLPPELEQRLRESDARGDEAAFQALLVEAIGPTVKAQLHEPAPPDRLRTADLQRRLNALQGFVASASQRKVPLPEEATARASFYADHA
jgi:antitoxin ParD1/3/4